MTLTSLPARLSSERERLEHLTREKASGALFSADRRYRYLLWRTWQESGPLVLFVGLNPSTADELSNDPTIRRCIGFAKSWGARGALVGNLFSFRATKPRDLFAADEPVGEDTDAWLEVGRAVSSTTVACWGAHGSHLGRSQQVRPLLGAVMCLGTTNEGEPRHPLYMRADTPLARLR